MFYYELKLALKGVSNAIVIQLIQISSAAVKEDRMKNMTLFTLY